MQTILKRKKKEKEFAFLFFFSSIDRETQCGSLSHPELLQTCVITIIKKRKKKNSNLFFSKRKESHTQTTYCIKRSITITSLSNTYFNIYISLRVKVSR